jgi:NlpC/P60 family/Bacterial dipeptidyl-peptidase Sh3 domain
MTLALLDPKIHPYRADIAAVKLKGLVKSERFVEPTAYQVTGGVASLRKIGAEDGEQLSQALHGETIDIYEETGGFGWGQMRSDGYVGWFDMVALSSPVLTVTRKVFSLRTYAYSSPSPKAPPHFLLSLGARVCETADKENGFVFCERAGWIYDAHLAGLNDYAVDAVGVAQQFLEAPYQWGGVESLGLDCSGLVQTAYKATGVTMPRDSYVQRTIGGEVEVGPDFSGLMRGDIVCWDQHVALMVNANDIIHANSHHMKVCQEPLSQAAPRICQKYGPILSVRRLRP